MLFPILLVLVGAILVLAGFGWGRLDPDDGARKFFVGLVQIWGLLVIFFGVFRMAELHAAGPPPPDETFAPATTTVSPTAVRQTPTFTTPLGPNAAALAAKRAVEEQAPEKGIHEAGTDSSTSPYESPTNDPAPAGTRPQEETPTDTPVSDPAPRDGASDGSGNPASPPPSGEGPTPPPDGSSNANGPG